MPTSKPRAPLARPLAGHGPSLLILEGDAGTLRREGHTRLTDEVTKMFAPLVADQTLRMRRVSISTPQELEFWKAFASASTYDAVLLLAHGSPDGLQAARGVSMSWADVARAIAPTKPRFLLAVSCFAAGSTVADALFDGIPSLERIVGSPAPITTAQARLALLELFFAAGGIAIPEEFSHLMSVLNAASTNGVLFTRTREGRVQRAATGTNGDDLFGFVLWALLQNRSSNDDLVRAG